MSNLRVPAKQDVGLLRKRNMQQDAFYRSLSEDKSRPLAPFLMGDKDALPMKPPTRSVVQDEE